MIPNILFITEQGVKLTRQGYSLVAIKDGERILIYPLEQLQQLVVMGRIEISTALISALLVRGVDTVFLYQDGRFKGRLQGPTSKNIEIREAQFRQRQDPERCLHVSKQLIYAKIKNTVHMLRQTRRGVWEEIRERVMTALRSVEYCRDLHTLRGIEGSFASLYFKYFPRLLNDAMDFKGRQKHPPPDPINILLSLGYTFLFNTLYGLVEAAGLDPYAGFFHQSRHGHPALVSDLVEPFRAPIVDQMVIALINNQIIKRDHFYQEENRWHIHTEALREFAVKYQKRLFATRKVKTVQLSTLGILQRTVWQFQKYVKGEQNDFQPFLFR